MAPPGFAGTSSSSPQVAGAAADVLQEQPSLSPAGLEATLEARSLARNGSTQRANDVGDGQLQMGLPAGAGTIAYATSNGSISSLLNVTDADGGSTHLLLDNAFAPSWSPDGTAVGDRHEQRPRDDRRRRDEPAGHRVGARANAQDPSWSPDGTKIAYATDDPPDGNGIWVVPAAGGTPTELIGITPQVTAPVWSPDGSKIAFLRQSGVGCVDLEHLDHERERLEPGRAGDHQRARSRRVRGPEPRLVARRHQAALREHAQPAGLRARPEPDSIAVANVNGTGDSILIDADVPSGSNFTDPEWSPNGDQIIFGNTPEQGPDRLPQGLYIANADGTGTTRAAGCSGRLSDQGRAVDRSRPCRESVTADRHRHRGRRSDARGRPGPLVGHQRLDVHVRVGAVQRLGCGLRDDRCTDSSYTLTSADVGSTLRVNVTAADGATSKSVLSAASAVVVGAPPFATALPTLSGIALTGQALTATTGTWPNVGLPFTYQWLRCDGNGANCAGHRRRDGELVHV